MKKKTSLLIQVVAAALLASAHASHAQLAIQDKCDVVATSPTNIWSFLVLEGENYISETDSNPSSGFGKVTNDGSLSSFYGNPILGTNTTASGQGALHTFGPLFGPHADKVTYQVQFATPGTYYLYMRFTMFENGGNLAHYLSEDSFFVPPSFNKDPQTDWPLPRDGYTEGCCDISGFLSIAEPGSEGVRTPYRSDTNYWEGDFHWNELKSSQFNNPEDANAANRGTPNVKFTYVVTPEMVGTPLDFTVSYREAGTTIDLFLFSTHPDLMDQYSQAELDQLLVKTVSVQDPSDVVADGTNQWTYLVMEGESYVSELNDVSGFVCAHADGSRTNFYGNPVLGTNSTASGRAALFTEGPLFGPHADKVTYQVQFATPGTYHLYMRFTMFENGGNLAHYLSEDSFFVPPDFNKDPQTDWPLPRDGYTEGCCDVSGFLSIAEPGSEGVRTPYRSDTNHWEGDFHWNELRSSQFNNPEDANEANRGTPNVKFTYVVTPEMVGKVQDFTISYREAGTTIDLFLFSTHTNLMDRYTQDELDRLLVSPRLSIALQGTLARVSWPTSLIGYVLESATSLTSGTWEPVAGTRSVIGSRNTVLLENTNDAARFYRLRLP